MAEDLPNAATIDEGLFSTSDYKIRSLILFTSDGQYVDINTLVIELHLYEDIWAGTMSGEMLISDSQDIVSKFALHGNEYLVVSIDKPSLDEPIEKVFRIYSIQNRSYDGSLNLNYVVHFCSEEILISAQNKISKSYKGMLISDIIKDICLNNLKIAKERLFIEPTEGVFDIVIPMMEPFEAINWLCTRAYAFNKSVFFFYENREGFNFSSFETMIKNDVYSEYYYGAKFADDVTKNSSVFNYLKGVEDFNVLKGIRYGSYSSEVMKFDFLNRRFEMNDYNSYGISSGGKLNKGMLANLNPNRLNQNLFNSFKGALKYVIGNDSDPNVNPMNPQFWLGPTVSKLGQLTNLKMIGVVPGDVLLKVGSIISIVMPNFVAQDGNFDTNEFRSGRYLISAVQHKFAGMTYTTTFEFMTDSLNYELPSHLKNSPAMELLKNS